MRDCIRRFASATLLAAAGAVLSFSVAAQEVPQQIQPPANEQLLLRVHAKGDQIYNCKGDGAQFTWTLKAPDARLFDKDGPVSPCGERLERDTDNLAGYS